MYNKNNFPKDNSPSKLDIPSSRKLPVKQENQSHALTDILIRNGGFFV
jgi:hypothetical protein